MTIYMNECDYLCLPDAGGTHWLRSPKPLNPYRNAGMHHEEAQPLEPYIGDIGRRRQYEVRSTSNNYPVERLLNIGRLGLVGCSLISYGDDDERRFRWILLPTEAID